MKSSGKHFKIVLVKVVDILSGDREYWRELEEHAILGVIGSHKYVIINERWSYFGHIKAKLGTPHFTNIAWEDWAVLSVFTSTIEVLRVDIDSSEFTGEVYMVQVNVGLVPDTTQIELLVVASLDRIRFSVGWSRKESEVGIVRDLADFDMRLILEAKSEFMSYGLKNILLGLVELQDRSVISSSKHFIFRNNN